MDEGIASCLPIARTVCALRCVTSSIMKKCTEIILDRQILGDSIAFAVTLAIVFFFSSMELATLFFFHVLLFLSL